MKRRVERRVSLETKNANGAYYGYPNGWSIPGNEGCGEDNPVNAGKAKKDIPPYKVFFIEQPDFDGDIRCYVCSETLYKEFRNEDRNERRRRDTESRCWIPSEHFGRKKCREDCEHCPFHRDERNGYNVSMDELYQDNDFEFADPDTTEEAMNEKFYQQALSEKLDEIISLMTDQDRTIVVLFREGKNDSEIAEKMGCTKQNVQKRRTRIFASLAEQLKDFR